MAIQGRWRQRGETAVSPRGRWPASDRLRRGRAGGNGLDAERLAEALGWFSVGLGVAGVAAPRLLARMIGVGDGRVVTTTLRLVGAAVLGATALDAVAARRLQDGRAAGTGAVRKSITINRPADALYRFWRDFANVPRFMQNIESVQVLGERRSRWKARGPGGIPVEWDSEVTDERPNELIVWRTLPGSQVEHSGVVRFMPAPGGRGTEVTVEMEYTPPGGAITATMAWLVGQAPGQQLAEDLRRFKQLMEAGEIVVSEALVSGVAQPPASEAAARAVVKGGGR